MTFSAKQSRAAVQLERFDFANMDDEPRQVPHMKELSLDQAMRVLVDGELEDVLNEVVPGLGTEIAAWPSYVIEDFAKAWQAHSGVVLPGGEPGKSSTSSTSSASTAARSRRTSRSGGSRSKR